MYSTYLSSQSRGAADAAWWRGPLWPRPLALHSRFAALALDAAEATPLGAEAHDAVTYSAAIGLGEDGCEAAVGAPDALRCNAAVVAPDVVCYNAAVGATGVRHGHETAFAVP